MYTGKPFDQHGNIWIISGTGNKNQGVSDLQSEPEATKSRAVNYERAISVTGYGLFNLVLLLAAAPVAWIVGFDVTTTAFILEATECIFRLNYWRKGLMLAMPYLGMVVAGPVWKFLCEDSLVWHFGKRNLIVIGFLGDVLCNLGILYNQYYWVFLTLKFISGVFIVGPLSLVGPFLAEFHHTKYQKNFGLWSGLIFSLPFVVAPALALAYVPRFGGMTRLIFGFEYWTWQFYFMLCAIPSLFVGLLTIWLLPESPKHLISHGRVQQAQILLRRMYRFNKGRSELDYPFAELEVADYITRCNRYFEPQFKQHFTKLRILVSKGYIGTFLNIILLQFVSMIGLQTMRLWVPNMFVALNNFETLIGSYFDHTRIITLCQMLFPGMPLRNKTCHCTYFTEPGLESAVYVNSTIIGASAITFGFIFSFLATTNIRKKAALIFSFSMTVIGAFAANWGMLIPYMLALCALIIVSSRIASGIIVSYVSIIIPVTLRSTALFSATLIGNLGAALGPFLFAVMLPINCLVAFIGIGVIALVSIILSGLLTSSPLDSPPAKPHAQLSNR